MIWIRWPELPRRQDLAVLTIWTFLAVRIWPSSPFGPSSLSGSVRPLCPELSGSRSLSGFRWPELPRHQDLAVLTIQTFLAVRIRPTSPSGTLRISLAVWISLAGTSSPSGSGRPHHSDLPQSGSGQPLRPELSGSRSPSGSGRPHHFDLPRCQDLAVLTIRTFLAVRIGPTSPSGTLQISLAVRIWPSSSFRPSSLSGSGQPLRPELSGSRSPSGSGHPHHSDLPRRQDLAVLTIRTFFAVWTSRADRF